MIGSIAIDEHAHHSHLDQASNSEPPPNAYLDGGNIPGSALPNRVIYLAEPTEPVKLQIGNRREHFIPTGRTVGHEAGVLHLLEWSYRTYDAE